MPCGGGRSVQRSGWAGRCGKQGWASLPLGLCRRPWPLPPGGQLAAGPCAAFAQSACPVGIGRWAPPGTGCHTLSQLWPGGHGGRRMRRASPGRHDSPLGPRAGARPSPSLTQSCSAELLLGPAKAPTSQVGGFRGLHASSGAAPHVLWTQTPPPADHHVPVPHCIWAAPNAACLSWAPCLPHAVPCLASPAPQGSPPETRGSPSLTPTGQ